MAGPIVTIDQHIVTQIGEHGEEYEIDHKQDQVRVNGAWVAVASRAKGAWVAFLRGQIPRSWLGLIARAMDERDGEAHPERVLDVLGTRTLASEVVKYGDP